MDGKNDLRKICSDCGILKGKRTSVSEASIKNLEKNVLNVQN